MHRIIALNVLTVINFWAIDVVKMESNFYKQIIILVLATVVLINIWLILLV